MIFKNTILSTILLVAFWLISCKSESSKTINYAIISGKIIDPVNDKLFIYENNAWPNTFENMIKYYNQAIEINKDGIFNDTIWELNNGDILLNCVNAVSMSMKQFSVYLRPGDKLSIELTPKLDSIISIHGGEVAEINRYLFAVKNWKTKHELQARNKASSNKGFNDDGYYNKEIKNKQLEFLNHFNLPQEFIDFQTKEIEYYYLRSLFNNEIIEKELESILDSTGLNDEVKYFKYSSYKWIVYSQLSKISNTLSERDAIDKDIAFMLTTEKYIGNEKIKNEILYRKFIASDPISSIYYEHFEELYGLYMLISTNKEHKKRITTNYKERVSILKGSPSPKFHDYESYAGGRMSLDDFIGKYVYIDIWATWCTWCLKEVPYLKELEKKYEKNDNIEFVSISIDFNDRHEAWKKMIEKKELGGVQLFADSAFQSDFIKKYKITGIPRFILIDPEGNIISANAPKPSNPELLKLFAKEGL
ncbi:MAG TPA: TlpA disulfide reductase family protein [Flavobacteriaceae bacterium]